jgi:hypothetical protein
MTTVIRKTVLAVLVYSHGVVAATHEADTHDCAYRGLPTDGTLDEFLARDDIDVPPGTPMVRLDHAGYARAAAFMLFGPTLDAALPAGMIDAGEGSIRSYRDEWWSEIGWSTKVASDIYVLLAHQAGIPVSYGSALPFSR